MSTTMNIFQDVKMTFIFFRLWLFGTWETWSWNCTRSNRIKTKYFKFSGRPIMKRFWLLRVPIGAYTSGTCPKSERSNRLKTLKMAHPSCWSVLNLYILFTLIVIYTFICCLFVFVFVFFFVCFFCRTYSLWFDFTVHPWRSHGQNLWLFVEP